MTANKQELLHLYSFLTEVDQDFALAFMKKLVLAWDPDFTKVTPMERIDLENACADFENGRTVRMEDIDWK